MSWFASFKEAVVSIVIGFLASVGIGQQVTPAPVPEALPTVVQEEVKESTSVTNNESKAIAPPKTKKTTVKVSEVISDPKPVAPVETVISVPTSAYTILFDPPKSQYTQDELNLLDDEAIQYFKANMNCDGLASYALTYCQNFESRPEIQLIKAQLQRNAEADARNATNASTSSY